MLITWTDDLAMGIEEIDRDHKILFDLVNQFHDAYALGGASQMLPYIFESLLEYTEYHFKAEEALMTRHGYPRLDEHKQSHKAVREELEGLHVRFQNGESTAVSIELIGLLANWWHFHIKERDQDYNAFFKAQGLAL